MAHDEGPYQTIPFSLRVNGIMNDICVSNPDLNNDYPLERITVPTLIVHAVDDPMPPFAGAKRMADHIPHARFIPIHQGDICCLAIRNRCAPKSGTLSEHTRLNEPINSVVMVN